MDRRKFLSITIPATGAIMMAPGCLNSRAIEEINQQFSGKCDFDQYDIVINGAGLGGYFAAINAAREGKRVLVIEKRTSPGYEITAKKRLWLGSHGFDRFPEELIQLFLPSGETQEIHNTFGSGINSSLVDDEILLFSGSLRKGMLRNLLINKVHVLLMTDVCGLLTDNENVQGVLLASKHGIHIVKCRSFIDASDNILFSRQLSGAEYKINCAGFVAELREAENPRNKEVFVFEEFGLLNNKIRLHRGKNTDDQLYMEFQFPVDSQELSEIEHQSRFILAKIGSKFPEIDSTLKAAMINEFALECSIYLEDDALPVSVLKGHYLLPNVRTELSCRGISEIEADAKHLVSNIEYAKSNVDTKSLLMPGANIPVNEIFLTDPHEPGLSVPLKRCSFNLENNIEVKEHCQVLVAGGGTSGAMAGRGSGEKGANTVVVDYFNDLGGTRTMGGVMGYYYGVRDPMIFKKQDEDTLQIASDHNMTRKSGHKLYHLQGILNTKGRFIAGSIMCGVQVNNNSVEGIIICQNGKLQLIKAELTIDATGDGDIAYFAGATYEHGNSRTGKTQNFSQWDIAGGGKLPGPTNRDYDIIDNTRISELQRGLFLSHYKAHFFDFHPMLTVRESRRIVGLYTLSLIDAAEGTHFEDIISRARSDYDPHYIGNSEYTRCGFLLPHSNVLTVEVPYRSIVPKYLDGLLISGRGFSQTHNHLQFTRMCPCLLVLGYLTGQIASEIAHRKIAPKDFDISGLQREWAANGNLPSDYASRRIGNLTQENDEINRRVKNLASGREEYLWECSRLPKEKTVPVLLEFFDDLVNEENKLLIAKALAWFRQTIGNDLIRKELNQLFIQELGEGYPGGYFETYDYIRGRQKNVIEGLFWRINQNIALLGMAGNVQNNDTIRYILENTSSGGEMEKWTSDIKLSRSVNGEHTIDYITDGYAAYNNERIDIRLIPYHNRIYNLCFYAERVPDPVFINGFEKLLEDKNIGGYKTKEYQLTRWRVYGGDLELYIAAALARCGSKKGYELLTEYLEDIHYNFIDYAASELKELTGKDYGYDAEAWKKYIRNLTFPQSVKRLRKEIEL